MNTRVRWIVSVAAAIAAAFAGIPLTSAASVAAPAVLEATIRSRAFAGTEPVAVSGTLPAPRDFAVAHVQRSAGAAPAQRGAPAPDDFVLTALDGAGRARARFFLPDPHVLRSEQPDATGLLHGQVLYRPSAEFVVVLPDDASIRRLRVDRAGETLGVVALSAAGAGEGPSTAAFPVSTIVNNGDPANRFDFVVVAEGYRAEELADFDAHARDFFGGFLAQEPYLEYARYFNVHRLDVPSNMSGADHPERADFRDTAFDATYLCNGIQRLICVSNAKVLAAVTAALPPAARDHIVVIVNDSEYGGSGGQIAVSSTHDQGVELVLHETGHSFGRLGDEYEDPWITCNPAFEPNYPNVTREVRREFIKWNHWIEPSTPVPSFLVNQNGVPGLYAGAAYCPAGLWRPTANSKMRSLGRPWEQINSEQLVLRTYSTVSPIESASPPENSVPMPPGSTRTFSVTTPAPRSHSLAVAWKLDGVSVGSGSSVIVTRAQLTPGNHTLEATVTDPTAFVRRDPTGLLAKTRSWTLVAQ